MALLLFSTAQMAGTTVALEDERYCHHHIYDCDCCEEDTAYHCYGKLQVEVLDARKVSKKHSKKQYYVELLKSKDGHYFTPFDSTSLVKGFEDVSFVRGECKTAIHHYLGYFLVLQRTTGSYAGPPTLLIRLRMKDFMGDHIVGASLIQLVPTANQQFGTVQPTPSTGATTSPTVQTSPGAPETPGFGFDLSREFDRKITLPLHAVKHGKIQGPIATTLEVILHFRPATFAPQTQNVAAMPNVNLSSTNMAYMPQTIAV